MEGESSALLWLDLQGSDTLLLDSRLVPDLEGNRRGKKCWMGVLNIGKLAQIIPRPASTVVHIVDNKEPNVASVPYADE